MELTKLIVLRGPSGSGKSSAAKALRALPSVPAALIEQDYLRRIVLKEKDVPNGQNIQLIQQTVLFALERGYSVIMEGIFDKSRYENMFIDLIARHPQHNYFFYFDIPLAETIRRHQSKPNNNEFGEKELRQWYRDKDFLECVQENIISGKLSLQEIIDHIRLVSNLIG